jgi:hypothetical protein
MSNKRDLIGLFLLRILSGSMIFLLFSGTVIFAQDASSPTVTYPAAPDLFGGQMGIERVAHTAQPVGEHYPIYRSEAKTSDEQSIWLQVDLGNPKKSTKSNCILS